MSRARRLAGLALAAVLLGSLTGCETPREACEAAGGAYTVTGSVPLVYYIKSGDVLIPIATTSDTYECLMPE